MAKERRNGKTPNGGDYSEMIYLNDNHDEVDKKDATKCVIYEMKNDGTLVGETWGEI